MSNFSANIKAILDLTGISDQIKEIEKNNINFSNITFNKAELISKIQSKLNKHKFSISIGNINGGNLANQAQNAGGQTGKAFSRAFVDSINTKISTGGIESSIAKVQQKFLALNNSMKGLGAGAISPEIATKIKEIEAGLQSLKNLETSFKSGNLTDEQLVSTYTNFNNVLLKVRNNIETVTYAKKQFENENSSSPLNKLADSLKASTLSSQMTTWMSKNTKASGEFGKAIDLLNDKLKALSSSGKLTEGALREIEKEFKSIKQQAISAGKTGKTFADTIKGAFASITKYVSVSTVIRQLIVMSREMFENVVNIDSAMTELKKVTDESSASYNKFLSKAGADAKEIGTTVTGIIESTANFARLGYDFESSQEMAKVANIYAVVGDEIENVEEATKSIISTLAAYKNEITNTMQIVDKFNEVGNRFAISSGGIGDALQRSASSLSAANNSLDQSIALITAANTVVQDPDSVGK